MGIIQSKKKIKASTVHAAPDFFDFFYPRGTAAGSRQEVERKKKKKKKAGWGGFSGTV